MITAKNLKILEEAMNFIHDMINFYIEAMKNIFKTWLKVEPNNTEKIKQYIDELLTNNTLNLSKNSKKKYTTKQQFGYTETKQYLKK